MASFALTTRASCTSHFQKALRSHTLSYLHPFPLPKLSLFWHHSSILYSACVVLGCNILCSWHFGNHCVEHTLSNLSSKLKVHVYTSCSVCCIHECARVHVRKSKMENKMTKITRWKELYTSTHLPFVTLGSSSILEATISSPFSQTSPV